MAREDHVERDIVLVMLMVEVNGLNERWIHVGIAPVKTKDNADRWSATRSVDAFGEVTQEIFVKSQRQELVFLLEVRLNRCLVLTSDL